MSRLRDLRERLHAGIPAEAKAITDAADKDNRDLNAEEIGKIGALAAEKDKLRAEIDRREKLVELQAPTAGGGSRVEIGETLEATRPWGSAGEFFGAVVSASMPGRSGAADLRLMAAATGMNQAVPSEGGFLVPPEYASKIWDGLNAAPDSLMARSDQYTVTGESLIMNGNAETSRATGSRYGGIQGYWINEADQITKSKPKFRQVRVEPQELAVLVYLTEKLLANAPALEQYVTRAAADEINFLVGDAIIEGTGAGKPLGILNSGCLITVNKEASQANGTFLKANANKMWARMHPRSRQNAIWLMNVDVEPTLDDFNTPIKNVAGTENVGGFGSMVYNAEKGTLKGRPIVFVEYCSSLGTLGDIILADMGAYIVGTKGTGIKQAMSMHVRFEYAETALRFMFAVDGQPWLASALTPFKGSNTLSTFVTLQAR